MACPTITLSGIDQAVWECIRQRASSSGISIPPGDSGTINTPEAEVEYAWDAAGESLAVTVVRKPAWIACELIESRVRQAAAGCGAR
ncbi:MAG TPA: hypothetical protein VHG08_23595 [Longimicrobium sp.]|nr:hypothetical protein [Longimicrobium sp.]